MQAPSPGPQPQPPYYAQGQAPPSGSGVGKVLLIVGIVLGGLVLVGGILAVLAISGMRKYLINAKSAEARNNVGQMAKDATSAYDREHLAPGAVRTTGADTAVLRSLCASATRSVPATASAIRGKKYQSSPSDWATDEATNAGFSCLKFTIDSPQYFMYSYARTGSGGVGDTFTAAANGDLNGDGVLSTFAATGRVGADGVVNVAPLTEINSGE